MSSNVEKVPLFSNKSACSFQTVVAPEEDGIASILLSIAAPRPGTKITKPSLPSINTILLKHSTHPNFSFSSSSSSASTVIEEGSFTSMAHADLNHLKDADEALLTSLKNKGRENIDLNAVGVLVKPGKETDLEKPRFQQPRSDDDLYTPRYVRYSGPKKEGLCGLCPEEKWLQLKDSAFWYHKQFFHGVSSVTGTHFAAPISIRTVWVVSEKPNSRSGYVAYLMNEGMCHSCKEWIPLFKNKKKFNFIAATYADLEKTLLLKPDARFKVVPALLCSNPIRISVGILENDDIFVPFSVNVSPSLLSEVQANRAGVMGGVWFRHAHKCHS